MRSCEGCPAYKTAAEASLTLKNDPGVPVCMRFHRPMSKPGMSTAATERIKLKFAEGCPSYGAPYTATNEVPPTSFMVAAPDPEVKPQHDTASKPRSCTGCANFIGPKAIKDELGWSWGMCAASGRLIAPDRYKDEARGCLFSSVGPPRDTTTGIHEMPIYTENFTANVKVTGHAIDPTGTYVDPQDYHTDREVTEDDTSCGIRAWRRIHDPKGSGKYVELPIFERDFFSDEERELIPMAGDDEHPEWYIDHGGLLYRVAVMWMAIDQAPALWGHAGTGKTELGRHLAWLMGLPFERINLRPDTEYEEVAGSPQFSVAPERRDDPEARPETWWKDGVMPRRWERPGVLLLDEPNMAPPDVWAFLRPAIDNSKQLVVDDRRRERHAFTFLLTAMNPAWSPQYVGTRELSSADMSRLRHVFVDLPPEDIERQIIVRSCSTNEPPYEPTDQTVDKVMAIAREIRGMVDDGALPVSWAIRENSAVLRMTQYFGLEDAYRLAITDGLEPETAKLILGVVKTYE